MRRMLFGVAMAVLCAAAWGGPPVLVPDSNMHEKVVPLSDLSVVPMRLTADSTACRAAIPRDAGPVFHGMPGHRSTLSRAG
jgi:hypothetical protein